MIIDSLENKREILQKFLEVCIFEGWTEKALQASFLKTKIDVSFLPFIFENGVVDVADFFIRTIDEQMKKLSSDIDFKKIKVRDKIKTLVQIRLNIHQEYKAQLEKLMQFYMNPKNINLALCSAYKTADLIWNSAGDNATDFNFYSKRIILAKVYIRTLLCFTKDHSVNNQKTLKLLDDEIEKVMQFHAFKFKVHNLHKNTGLLFTKIGRAKDDLLNNPKNFIKKLPFFRLQK